MRYKKETTHSFFSILLIGVAFNILGCDGSEKWKEEVQLSDGQIIVVERETLHEGGGGEIISNRSGTKPKERIIRFVYPNGSGKMIEWRSTKVDERMWPEKPLILDMESGQPIVYAIEFIRAHCGAYSKYFYRKGIWFEETLPESFKEHTTNLFIRDGVDMPKFVDLKLKHEGNAEIGYPEYLRKVGPKREICE